MENIFKNIIQNINKIMKKKIQMTLCKIRSYDAI